MSNHIKDLTSAGGMDVSTAFTSVNADLIGQAPDLAASFGSVSAFQGSNFNTKNGTFELAENSGRIPIFQLDSKGNKILGDDGRFIRNPEALKILRPGG